MFFLINIACSTFRRYFLYLLVNVVFIFLFASTYLQLIRDLVDFPAKIPVKLAKALQSGGARNFFLSYVILQALGVMPLQLLNLGIIIPHILYRLFYVKTPRGSVHSPGHSLALLIPFTQTTPN